MPFTINPLARLCDVLLIRTVRRRRLNMHIYNMPSYIRALSTSQLICCYSSRLIHMDSHLSSPKTWASQAEITESERENLNKLKKLLLPGEIFKKFRLVYAESLKIAVRIGAGKGSSRHLLAWPLQLLICCINFAIHSAANATDGRAKVICSSCCNCGLIEFICEALGASHLVCVTQLPGELSGRGGRSGQQDPYSNLPQTQTRMICASGG